MNLIRLAVISHSTKNLIDTMDTTSGDSVPAISLIKLQLESN